MKKINGVLVFSLVAAALSSFVMWDALQKKESPQTARESEHHHAGKEMVQEPAHAAGHQARAQDGQARRSANPWQSSPFETGEASANSVAVAAASIAQIPAPEKEVVSEAELARRQKMTALGYMVPTDYYSKDLKTLRQLAKAGDAFAMVHLGEKYAFELNGQVSNPEFEQGMDYPKAAKQAFKDALVAGNIRSAGIIAELYFQEKNATEAYAWHLISDQLGDDISANWFRRTDMAQQASPAIKQAAQARAAQIMAELKLSKKST